MVNPLCPLANPFVVVVCLGLAPSVSGLLFSFDETQIWLGGFAGRRGCRPCVVVWLILICLLMNQLCPCTNVFLTAYAQVRTSLRATSAKREEKKICEQLPRLPHKTKSMSPSATPAIDFLFAWQAWPLWHWDGSGGALGAVSAGLHGRRGTWRRRPSFWLAGAEKFSQTILACFTEAWWKSVQAMLSHALFQAMFQRCFSLGLTLGS